MAARKTTAKVVKRKRCIAPGCKNIAQSRGLCWTCLAAAKARIRNGGRDEEQNLIDAGLMLPLKRLGRPPESALARALAKRRT